MTAGAAPRRPACRQVRLLNVKFDCTTMDELLELRSGTFATIHVDSIAKLQKDRAFYDVLDKFDIITCDSQILYLAAKVLRRPLPARVSGSDYFPRFYQRYARDPDTRIFLCGAMGNIAGQARARINERVGREIVVGAYGPPYGWLDDPDQVERVIAMINGSGATVLVVGVSPPVQELFIHRYRERMPAVRLLLPLGGTIDYEAGAVVRPPSFITTLGLEWLWRLVREPRRRWRRYLIHQPPVLYQLARDALGRYEDPFADTTGGPTRAG